MVDWPKIWPAWVTYLGSGEGPSEGMETEDDND
jgi:hypothetical protein